MHNRLNLNEKMISGSLWVFFLRFLQLIFNLIKLIILARILTPNDFGLIGISLLTISTIETLTQTGFENALIQKSTNINSYLDTAWTFLVIRGVILYAIIFFMAPLVALFFDAPNSELIIQICSLTIIFRSFSNIGVIYFQKDLVFKKDFLYEFMGIAVEFIITLVTLIVIKGVWAIVIGLVTGNAFRCITSFVIHPYKPRFSFNLMKFYELFGFGRWIMWSSILNFLLIQGDDIFVAKVLGVSALGLYQMAYNISNIPATEISHLIAKVSFPAYSKIQHDRETLRKLYESILLLTAFISIPIGCLILFFVSDFTQIVLGSQWLSMIPVVQILSLFGILRALGATTGVLFVAIGKPDISTKIKLCQLILFGIVLYPFALIWGLSGVATAALAHAFIFNVAAILIALSVLEAGIKQFFKSILTPIFFSGLMTTILIVLKKYLFSEMTLLPLTLLMVTGIVLYTFFAFLFDNYLQYGLRSILKNHITSLTK